MMVLIGVLVAALVGGGIAVALTVSGGGSTESASTSTTSIRPSTTVTTMMPTTSTSPPTTAPPQPTELQTDWAYEPNKCNVDGGPHTWAHSATRTYEATATIGLWTQPTTASTLLATIPVLTYGPGGIGCPDGLAPQLTITCKVLNGQMISGPFGNDPIWLRTTYNGITGFVPDEWVDTRWDVSSIRSC